MRSKKLTTPDNSPASNMLIFCQICGAGKYGINPSVSTRTIRIENGTLFKALRKMTSELGVLIWRWARARKRLGERKYG